MIDTIKKHEILSDFIEDSCCENGVCVSFDDSIPEESYVILKVDNYYKSLKLAKTPASVDCLIIRNCLEKGYGLTIVELKDINNSKGFNVENIKEKFETTISDFVQYRFSVPLEIDYKDIKLFFVSNKEIYKRDLGLKMETLINVRFKYGEKNLMIRPKMPTPTIKNCYE